MMDEFILWPKPYILLSTTCDEVLSWMIEIWMRHRLVSGNNRNTINLKSPNFLQGMTNNVGFKLSVGETISQFTIIFEQDN